jgi:hypothetical protein
MPLFSQSIYVFEKIIYRIADILRPSAKLPPESERDNAELPDEGSTISVEKALNSRCSSDDDGNPRKFHWGMFDRTKKLSEEQIRPVISLAKTPRLTDGKLEIRLEHNVLTFLVDNRASEIQREKLMVESGMQQQAVGLTCSALGIGMVMKNLGKDGSLISDNGVAAIRIRLGAMKPSYDGAYWSEMAPAGRAPWLKGNLPDPVRNGEKPLIATLAALRTSNAGSEAVTEKSLSQLLWAARGRTPHLYKSRPWGVTIPTWGGEQNISSVYVISEDRLSKYVNWHKGRPTSSLLEIKTIDRNLVQQLKELFPLSNTLVAIGRNENTNRSLWEVGYQLLNILIQASALDLRYNVVLLDGEQRRLLANTGIAGPVAIISRLEVP